MQYATQVSPPTLFVTHDARAVVLDGSRSVEVEVASRSCELDPTENLAVVTVSVDGEARDFTLCGGLRTVDALIRALIEARNAVGLSPSGEPPTVRAWGLPQRTLDTQGNDVVM